MSKPGFVNLISRKDAKGSFYFGNTFRLEYKTLRRCVNPFKTMHSNLLFLYAQILNPPLFVLHTQNAVQHY